MAPTVGPCQRRGSVNWAQQHHWKREIEKGKILWGPIGGSRSCPKLSWKGQAAFREKLELLGREGVTVPTRDAR